MPRVFSFVQSGRQFLNCSKYVLVRYRFAKDKNKQNLLKEGTKFAEG